MNSNKIFSVILIILGIIFILDNFSVIPGISKIWPLFVIVFGLGFILISFNKKKGNHIHVGFGTLFILLGFLFLYLNFTQWAKLATLWPIFLVIVGLSISFAFAKIKNNIFLYIGIILVTLGAIFYLVFSISYKLWPISLLLLGFSLLFLKVENK